MSIRNTIVGFSQLQEAFPCTTEDTTGAPSSAPELVTPTAEEQARLFNALAELKSQQRHTDVLTAPNDQMAALMQSFTAGVSNASGQVGALPAGDVYEAKFDSQDWLRWAGSFFTWWRGIVRHDWLQASDIPESLANQARVAILGDWGTGLYGAPLCSHSIEHDQKGYQLLLHLGDVYYSGTEDEVQQRFLGLWPRNPGAVSRSLNSNHEMYTGGHAYFNLTLKQFGQAASYFAMQNDYWILVGLDTAYEEHNLTDDQVVWLSRIAANAGNRKIILFSHHQPFARLEVQGDRLQEKLAALLTSRKIFAWYWGHEHRCVIYDRHAQWGLWGRCVGHSGFPYFRDDFQNLTKDNSGPHDTVWWKMEADGALPGGLFLDGPNPYLSGHESEYGPNGYMTLELSDNKLNEIVHAPDGQKLYQRQLS